VLGRRKHITLTKVSSGPNSICLTLYQLLFSLSQLSLSLSPAFALSYKTFVLLFSAFHLRLSLCYVVSTSDINSHSFLLSVLSPFSTFSFPLQISYFFLSFRDILSNFPVFFLVNPNFILLFSCILYPFSDLQCPLLSFILPTLTFTLLFSSI